MFIKSKSTHEQGTKILASYFFAARNFFFSLILVLLVTGISTSYAATATTEPSAKETQATADNHTSVATDTPTKNNPSTIPTPATTDSGSNPGLFSANAKFDQENLNTIPDDENGMRLLEIHIGKYKLEDLIVAYQKNDIIFVPLGLFSELIDLAIETNPDTGIGLGFIFKENRLFHLDAKRGEITIDGKLQRFNKQQVALRQFDDIYVDSNLLGKWLPMKLDIDLFASRLKIFSDEPLPFEKRKNREERIKLVQSRLPRDRGYEKQELPHKDWTYPLINQSARIGVQRDANEEFKGTFGYSTYATADLMNMESSWYLSGTNDELIEDARATFSKHDPNGSLLGSMSATEYAFGHINEPRVELISRPLDPLVGVLVSNYPLARQLQYDSHNFRGDLPPGWEVELYRNNDLLRYISTSSNGQYQFDDVPLLFGTNYFRLVFYGPQGQQREETHNFNLNSSLTGPGKHYYRAIVSDDKDFGYRAIAEYDFGLNKQLSLGAKFASIPLDSSLVISKPEENHNYFSGGVRGFHKSLFYRSDVVVDMQSGSAIDWEIQTRLGGAILNIGQSYFQNDYISEEFPETFQAIQQRTELKIDTAIPASFLPRIPVTFEMEHKKFDGNTVISRYGNRVSMQQFGLSLSNTLNRNEQTGLPTIDSGNFQISRRAFGYNFRGSISYLLSPVHEISATSITMDGLKLWGFHISSGYSHIVQSKLNEIFLNLNRSHGKYSLGLNSRYSTGGIATIDLTFAIGIGRDPRTKQWNSEYRPIASQGSMSVQTFLDNNQNGSKEPDEKGIGNTQVRINGGKVNRKADENGIIFITGVEPYRDVDVDLVLETLDDPLWQPAIKGKRVNLRPGYTAQLNFPVIVTGEIDGTAFVQFGDTQREVSGVIIELLDLDGKVFRTVKTAYDGFYLLDKIPPGKYQLRVSREQTDTLNLLPVQPTFVVIETDQPIVNGMDFVLQKRNQ